MVDRTRHVSACMCAALSLVFAACKSKGEPPKDEPRASSASATASATAPPEIPELPSGMVPRAPDPEPPPVPAKLAAAVEKVGNDALVHEHFRLLLDGVSAERLGPLIAKRLASAPKEELLCARVHVFDAAEAAKGENGRPALVAALGALLNVIDHEVEARKLSVKDAKCPRDI